MESKVPYYMKDFTVKGYIVRILVRLPQLLLKTRRPDEGFFHPDNKAFYDTGIDAPTEIKLVQSEDKIAVRLIILGLGGFISISKSE